MRRWQTATLQSLLFRSTYIGVGAQKVESRGVQGTGEALEDGAIVVVGTLGENTDGILDRGADGALLELDNVLVGDELLSRRTGLQERS